VRHVLTRALMYHDVVQEDSPATGFAGEAAEPYKLGWNTFRLHLDRIGQYLEAPSVASDLVGGNAASPRWLLTFDDGGASAVEIGNELAQRGWRGHFFVISGRLGTAGFLDEDAVAGLHRMGHVIGSHSVTHPARMSALSFAEAVAEWETSVGRLSEIVGTAVDTGSVPGGYYSRKIARAARQAGVEVLFTSDPVRTTRVVEGVVVVGRYAVRRDTTADKAAAAAVGRTSVWLRQYAAWNVRKPLKRIAGSQYTRARQALHRRRARR
jgi:peptidoglycan/xylan/chitin deacetylase (PgdA/CDA1 family)